MRKVLIVAVVLVALGAASARADEWSKKYSFTGKPQLRVETNDGAIEVISSDQKDAEVTVRTDGWKIPAEVRVVESQSGDHVDITARVPHRNFNFFGIHPRSLRIELRIPREADLDLTTGDGDVTLQPVAGNIRVETGDGRITARGLKGEVRLHTGDGHIEGEGFDGVLSAESGDGNIRVDGRFDTLHLKTGDGRMDATAALGSKMASDWSLRSGDGTITLLLPDGFAAELDAHTGDGRITLDFPVMISGSLSTSTVRGKMNGGGPTLDIRTRDGSIHIERK